MRFRQRRVKKRLKRTRFTFFTHAFPPDENKNAFTRAFYVLTHAFYALTHAYVFTHAFLTLCVNLLVTRS